MIISVSRTPVHDCAEIHIIWKSLLMKMFAPIHQIRLKFNYKGRQIYQFPLCETEKTCLSKLTSCTHVEGSLDAWCLWSICHWTISFFFIMYLCASWPRVTMQKSAVIGKCSTNYKSTIQIIITCNWHKIWMFQLNRCCVNFYEDTNGKCVGKDTTFGTLSYSESILHWSAVYLWY